jgi:hypothetical protein
MQFTEVSIMARSATLDPVVDKVKSAANDAYSRASHSAKAAMRDAAERAQSGREAYSSVFHDLTETAEDRLRQGEQDLGRFGRAVASEASARPVLALVAVATAAALTGSIMSWALSRRG